MLFIFITLIVNHTFILSSNRSSSKYFSNDYSKCLSSRSIASSNRSSISSLNRPSISSSNPSSSTSSNRSSRYFFNYSSKCPSPRSSNCCYNCSTNDSRKRPTIRATIRMILLTSSRKRSSKCVFQVLCELFIQALRGRISAKHF